MLFLTLRLCLSCTPEQESANCGMHANSCLLLIYVNKGFLEHSQIYLFTYCLQLCSYYSGRVQSGLQSLYICCLALYRKGLLTLTQRQSVTLMRDAEDMSDQ